MRLRKWWSIEVRILCKIAGEDFLCYYKVEFEMILMLEWKRLIYFMTNKPQDIMKNFIYDKIKVLKYISEIWLKWVLELFRLRRKGSVDKLTSQSLFLYGFWNFEPAAFQDVYRIRCLCVSAWVEKSLTWVRRRIILCTAYWY